MSLLPTRTVLSLLALLAVACSGAAAGERVCPEYRNLPCLTARICELDTARGCQVCICQGDAYEPDEELNPNEP